MIMARERRKVALLIETSLERGRGIIRGIIRYANLYGLWDFHISPGHIGSGQKQPVSSFAHWNGDGIIARVGTPELASLLIEKNLPLILLGHPEVQEPLFKQYGPYFCICMQNKEIGRMAADFFIRKGFTEFGYITALPEDAWSKEREVGFLERLREEGISPEHFHLLYTREVKNEIELDRRFCDKLKKLPKPIAVLATRDSDGQKLIECCSSLFINVPAEVSVLGVDNDDLLCVTSSPPLSSISIDAEGAGFQAAAILDRMMNNPNDPELVPGIIPLKAVMIHERQSTSTDQFSDRLVADIFEFLRANVNSPINVSDVIREVKKSRRMVEKQFKSVTGETIHDAILRLKLDAVKRFLIDTGMPLHQVAEESGFGDDSYLGQIFKKKFGMTMDGYRKQYRKEYDG